MHNTYAGWRLMGRQVKAGEKGRFRNEYGDFMYDWDQTKRRFLGISRRKTITQTTTYYI